MKVYIITKGEYSDYSIYAVAIDKQRAEELKRYFTDNCDDAIIEEYDIDDYKPIHEGKTQYCVYFRTDGTVYIHKPSWFEKDQNKIIKDFNYGHKIYLWAIDEAHALKIASDKFAEYKYRKAMNE